MKIVTALTILAATILFGWMLNQIRKAPKGYQDEHGFHEREEP